MRRDWMVGLVGLMALGGCAQAPANVGAATAAVTAAGGRFDESAQTILFTADGAADAVDAHVTIADDRGAARVANVRMRRGSDGAFVAGPLALAAGDRLSFWFTTLSRGVGHDTAATSAEVSTTFQPLALRAEIRGNATQGYAAHTVSQQPLDWVDLHYRIDGAAQQNVRMARGAEDWSLPLSLRSAPTPSAVDYFITYSVGGQVFDGGQQHYRPSDPDERLVWIDSLFVPDRTTQGPPAGCVADGDWYHCDPYDFSHIYTSGGYHFDGDVLLVPFTITGTGPYGEALLKTVRLGFHYDGAAPRTGSGLVLLPTSTVRNGLPPRDQADEYYGKRVLSSWVLHASYLLGGDGLGVALVDVNGVRSHVVDVAQNRSTYCRYGCSLEVPIAQLAGNTGIDLEQIRYVAFTTEDGATVDQTMTISDLWMGPAIVF
jgi:hypothetical protein